MALGFFALVLLADCGGPKETSRALPSPTPIIVPSVAPSEIPSIRPSPVRSIPSPTPRALPSVSSIPSPPTITFHGATFHVPADWDIDNRGTEAYLGHLAGGPQDVELALVVGKASLESFRPTTCPQEGDPAVPALKVETVISGGFLLDDGRTIPYRQWRVTCPNGTSLHRAWALPNLVVYEQRPTAETEKVVRSVTL